MKKFKYYFLRSLPIILIVLIIATFAMIADMQEKVDDMYEYNEDEEVNTVDTNKDNGTVTDTVEKEVTNEVTNEVFNETKIEVVSNVTVIEKSPDTMSNEDREQIIQETYKDGITKFVCAGYNIPSSLDALELSKKHEFIYSICGISPNDIPQSEQQLWKDIDEISKIATQNNDKKLVAIGEIGLDYYWNKENKELQTELDSFRPVLFHDMRIGTITLYSKGGIDE